MATRRYGTSPGDGMNQVTEDVGSAVASDVIEVTVELADTAVNAFTGTRSLTKEEVILGLQKIIAHIEKGNWLPA